MRKTLKRLTFILLLIASPLRAQKNAPEALSPLAYWNALEAAYDMIKKINQAVATHGNLAAPMTLYREERNEEKQAQQALTALFEHLNSTSSKQLYEKDEHGNTLVHKIVSFDGSDTTTGVTKDQLVSLLVSLLLKEQQLKDRKKPGLANLKNDNDQTPLHCAIESGNTDFIEHLLEYGGADPRVPDRQGYKPSDRAWWTMRLQIYAKLLAQAVLLDARERICLPLLKATPENK